MCAFPFSCLFLVEKNTAWNMCTEVFFHIPQVLNIWERGSNLKPTDIWTQRKRTLECTSNDTVSSLQSLTTFVCLFRILLTSDVRSCFCVILLRSIKQWRNPKILNGTHVSSLVTHADQFFVLFYSHTIPVLKILPASYGLPRPHCHSGSIQTRGLPKLSTCT